MADQDFDRLYAQVPTEQKKLLRDFRANHPYKELDVGGVRWRYTTSGQGDKALMFLPGGFLAADMWFYSILTLEDRYRIVSPDSFTLQGTFDMDNVCRALVRILDAEGIEKAILIGLSAGGGIAQYFLQEYPERVAHVVLSHCGVFDYDPEAEKLVKRLFVVARLLPLWAIQRIVLSWTAGDVPPTSTWIEFHNAFFREAELRTTKTMYLGFLQSSAEGRRDFVSKPDVVEAWPGEILILGSKDDEVAIPNLEELQARYPKARMHLFEEGGHHTFMLFPEVYTAVLSKFLAEVDD